MFKSSLWVSSVAMFVFALSSPGLWSRTGDRQ